jgi:Tfp pilus assembly protein PilX
MRNHPKAFSNPSKQEGVVLFVALILLLILSLLGVTAARMQTVEERMARNEDNRQLGAQAAEAGLQCERFVRAAIVQRQPGIDSQLDHRTGVRRTAAGRGSGCLPNAQVRHRKSSVGCRSG